MSHTCIIWPCTFSIYDNICEGGGLPLSPDHIICVDAVCFQLRDNAIANAVVSYLADQIGPQAQPCSSREGIGAVATTLGLLRQGIVTVYLRKSYWISSALIIFL